jgi:hypothetical protein
MKHILYLTNDQLVAMLIKGKTIVGRETFSLTDISEQSFRRYIAEHQLVPTRVVTDLIEEDFRLDTIPHLRGSDQEAVVSRKLAQIYRASPFRHALVQGRLDDGRRDDRIFYHAVTNPDLLKSVLAVLEAEQVSLEGVSSSAVLSSRLLKELDIFFPHTLLVTIVPDFGLRQTYFQNKQIRFSRLTPIIYDETQTVGQLIAAETSRTWQYLDSLRNFSSGDSLEVCLLVHERDKLMLQDAIRTFPLLRYRFLDINDVATKLGALPAPSSSHAEEILAHLISRGNAENHFAEERDTRFMLFRRTRTALVAATACVLLAGVAGAAFNFLQATRISTQIAERTNTQQRLQSEYQSITNAIREQKLTADAVRDSSIFFNSQIRPQPAAPGEALRLIAEASAEFDRIRIVNVGWRVSADDNAASTAPSLTDALMGIAGTVASTITGRAPASSQTTSAAANNVSGDPPLAANKFHVITIDAAIVPYDDNLREAIAEVERYAKRIEAIVGASVKIDQFPADTSSRANIKVGDASAAKETRFLLRIVRKVGGAT